MAESLNAGISLPAGGFQRFQMISSGALSRHFLSCPLTSVGLAEVLQSEPTKIRNRHFVTYLDRDLESTGRHFPRYVGLPQALGAYHQPTEAGVDGGC
jgi:hypothetical protein